MRPEPYNLSHFLPLALTCIARGILCDNLRAVDTQNFGRSHAGEDATKISRELFPQSLVEVAERNSLGALANSQDSDPVHSWHNSDLSPRFPVHCDVSAGHASSVLTEARS
jgi:hypothetical protein